MQVTFYLLGVMARITRKPSAIRREEIALAILRIVGERGIAALSTTTLSEEVGMTSGALFRHFASREEMIQEAALRKLESTFPDEGLPPLERLLALADNRVRTVGTDPGVNWMVGSDEACHHLPPATCRQLTELVERTKRFVLDALHEGATQGVIRQDIEPNVLFVPVMGTIHALIGMRGAHSTANRSGDCATGRVLAALALLLAPEGGGQAGFRTRPRHGNQEGEDT